MIVEISERMSSEVNFGATVTTPTGFDPEKEFLPMIVFLHGAGERGEDLSIVNKVGLPKYFTADPDYKGLRVITLSPQCPDYTVWNDVSLQLFQFILKAAKAYNADMDRISVTGLSMGGFGTWEMVISHPDFFSAAAPICGGGMDWRIPSFLPTPIRAFHGDADPVVPVVYSRILCRAVNDRGGNAVLTEYPGCDHDSWTAAYETTDVIEWLAASRKNAHS